MKPVGRRIQKGHGSDETIKSRKIFAGHLQNRNFYLPLHHDTTRWCTIADGAIAQLVEQRTENPCVPGSIPGGTT